MTRIDALKRCIKHLTFGKKHGDKKDAEALDTIERMISMSELQRKKDAWHRWNAGMRNNRLDQWDN